MDVVSEPGSQRLSSGEDRLTLVPVEMWCTGLGEGVSVISPTPANSDFRIDSERGDPRQTVPSLGAHRSDIQGLRAVAVIAVVLFHVSELLPGGFAGVDILKFMDCSSKCVDMRERWIVVVQSEHHSLREFIKVTSSPAELERVGFVSFTQWPFALAALTETALTMQAMGSKIYGSFWVHRTPMKDIGWSTHRSLARLVVSRTSDEFGGDSLVVANGSDVSSVSPPIKRRRAAESTRDVYAQTLGVIDTRENQPQ